ncbi:MAG: hypothetical protein NC115_01820 [Bacteroidales bacterium]|nr:hypothetical protein [Bacteroidales bacterium]
MRKRYLTDIGAFALPMALVISLLIMLMVLLAYSSVLLQRRACSEYNSKRQDRLDLRSAVLVRCSDSTACNAGETAALQLFDDDTSSVTLSVNSWGLYETVVAGNRQDDALIMLVGKHTECSAKAALWLCDRNRALSLAGNTEISGLVYIPLSGINYTWIHSGDYAGRHIPESDLRIASAGLPPADSSVLQRAEELCLFRAIGCPVSAFPAEYRSFQDGTAVVMPGKHISGRLPGNIHLCGDVIEFKENAEVSDVIVSARKVVVSSGFKGRMQLFVSDTVIVEAGAMLEYPSGIYVGGGEARPYAVIHERASLSGYAIVLGQEPDSQLRFPGFIMEPGSHVDGLVYVDGSCNIEGSISGAVYIRDCYHYSDGNIYAGTLCDVSISRDDSLAFPVFMDGLYRRKIIKKLH